MKKTFLVFFTLTLIVTLLINSSANASVEKQVDDSLEKIKINLQQEIANKTLLSLSSNPYDYVKDSVEFRNIINLGEDALPVLEQKIDETSDSGLIDYILSIAIEDISKVDLKKKDDMTWETGDEFSLKWKKHLKNIPANVDTADNVDKNWAEQNKSKFDNLEKYVLSKM